MIIAAFFKSTSSSPYGELGRPYPEERLLGNPPAPPLQFWLLYLSPLLLTSLKLNGTQPNDIEQKSLIVIELIPENVW